MTIYDEEAGNGLDLDLAHEIAGRRKFLSAAYSKNAVLKTPKVI